MNQLISKFFEPKAFQKYLKNTSWMLFEKFFRLGLLAVIGFYMANYLGKDRFGELNYAISLVSLFGAFATLGTRSILMRELANTSHQDKILTSTSLFLHLAGALASIVALVIFTFFLHENEARRYLVWVVSLLLPFQAFLLVEVYFQAKTQAKQAVKSQLGAVLLGAILKILLIYFEAPLIYFAWAIVAESALLAIFLVMTSYKRRVLGLRGISRSKMPSFIKSGFPFILAGVATTVYMKIDQVMLVELSNAGENGLYAAAIRYSEAFYFLPVIICNSLVAAIANLYQTNRQKYLKRIQQLFDIMVWMGVGIAVAITLTSDWLVATFLKPDYAPASQILEIHIWALVFVALGIAHDKWLIQEKLYSLSLWRTSVGAILNIVLNFFLIPALASTGAAWATLISYAVASFFINFFIPKSRYSFYMQLKAFFFPFRLILLFFKRHSQ